MNLNIFLPGRKKWRFLSQNNATLRQNLITKQTPFFAQNWRKSTKLVITTMTAAIHFLPRNFYGGGSYDHLGMATTQ
jgi:hypothetical protein